jgi:hypothetical protein
MGVFEMFDMNLELERGILANKPEDEIFAIVRKTGMLTMKEDAIIKAANGIIPFEEVNTLGGEFELPEEEVKPIAEEKPVVLGEDVSDEEVKKEEDAPILQKKELEV